MSKIKSGKKGFWGIWMFYFLIAFEIIYMITPFGIYYYSVYGKGLNLLNNNLATAWLSSFFLPHIVETSSFILNIYKDIGWTLTIIGFLTFCIGAGQIYYYKLSKKGAVTGGIYNFIRHPQYVSLSICSFGLLLVWPRYLVLIMFITMSFTYYFLGKAEEKECEEKFGESYTIYKNKTNMFLPFNIPLAGRLPNLPKSGIKRKLVILTLYVFALLISIVLANGIKSYSIGTLYTSYVKNHSTISAIEIEKDKLEKIIEIALSDKDVQNRLDNAKDGSKTKFLNYVLPDKWYFSDIPMNMAEGIKEGHYHPKDYNKNLYKMIFTKANIKTDKDMEGKELILNTIKRNPVIEVTIDLAQNNVISIVNSPSTVRWGDIPTPLY